MALRVKRSRAGGLKFIAEPGFPVFQLH